VEGVLLAGVRDQFEFDHETLVTLYHYSHRHPACVEHPLFITSLYQTTVVRSIVVQWCIAVKTILADQDDDDDDDEDL
jgi:hypothetical protein